MKKKGGGGKEKDKGKLYKKMQIIKDKIERDEGEEEGDKGEEYANEKR